MTIQFTDKTYILGVWFSEDPKTNNNWLCTIIRDDSPEGDWEGTSRFRYNKDDKIFDSED